MGERGSDALDELRTGVRLAHLEDEVRAENLQAELVGRLGAATGRRTSSGTAAQAQAQAQAQGREAGQAAPVSDRPDLMDHVRAQLLPGEFLHAVLDLKGRGPGFVAVTSRRVVLYDRRTRAVVSVPYARILAVAARDEGEQFAVRGLAASDTLVLTSAHGSFELPFRSAEKAHVAHELILRYVL